MNESRAYFPSIIEQFYKFEQERADQLFLSEPVRQVYQNFSWGSAGVEIRKMAAVIQGMGLEKGDKIAILSKNCAYWIMADLAIMMAGCVAVPLYPNSGAGTLREILLHSEAKMIFVGKLDQPDALLEAIPEHLIRICFPFYPLEGCLNWATITRDQPPLEGKPVQDPDSLLCIIYTSGTTGQPKGVMHSYYSMSYAVASFLKANPTIVKERFFSYLPLCHVAEKMLVECGTIFTGSTMFFIESMDRFSINLQDTSPTIFLAVPRIWEKMKEEILKKMPQRKLDLILSIPIISTLFKKMIRKKLGLSKAHFLFTGASPINPSILEWFDRIGMPIMEAYGMTENLALSHANRKGSTKYGTVGTTYAEVEVRIGKDSEVQVKSPASMRGYFKEPTLTAESFEDGFLKTGDQGSIDQEGYLTITGRTKDQFKTSKGKYISPAPIESKLLLHHFIDQVCVVGNGMPYAMGIVILTQTARSEDHHPIRQGLTEFLNQVNAELEQHERISKLILLGEEWTVENGFLTPTLKIKRKLVDEKYQHKYPEWSIANENVIFSD